MYLATLARAGASSRLVIEQPLDETLFPPEIAPPLFRWKDDDARSDLWLVTIEFPDGGGASILLCGSLNGGRGHRSGRSIKKRSLEKQATVTIVGVNRRMPSQVSLDGPHRDQDVGGQGRDAVVLPRGEPAVRGGRQGPVADPLAVRHDLVRRDAAGRAGEAAGLRQLPLVLRRRHRPGHGHRLRQRQGLVRDRAGAAST